MPHNKNKGRTEFSVNNRNKALMCAVSCIQKLSFRILHVDCTHNCLSNFILEQTFVGASLHVWILSFIFLASEHLIRALFRLFTLNSVRPLFIFTIIVICNFIIFINSIFLPFYSYSNLIRIWITYNIWWIICITFKVNKHICIWRIK